MYLYTVNICTYMVNIVYVLICGDLYVANKVYVLLQYVVNIVYVLICGEYSVCTNMW